MAWRAKQGFNSLTDLYEALWLIEYGVSMGQCTSMEKVMYKTHAQYTIAIV